MADTRELGVCDHCGKRDRLNVVRASHSADVMLVLCDDCFKAREQELERMYRGD